MHIENGSRRTRILLVEDHADTLAMLTRLLTLSGYQVVTASTATAAKGFISACEFDLLITDVGLPDGDGLELLAELRKRCNAKAIVLTGYAMPDDIQRFSRAGFSAYIAKPADFERIKAQIERVMGQSACLSA